MRRGRRSTGWNRGCLEQAVRPRSQRPAERAVGLLRLPRESRGEAMPESSLKDKNYDLVNVLHASLHNVWMLEEYIRDAEKEGDQELAHWFKRIQENNVKAGEQGKEMLVKRLSNG
jgi:hypothetical protein